MEFCIPWQRWNVQDIQYGLSQLNTRIEGGLFVPIYYTDKHVKCQAVHLLSPPLQIVRIDSLRDGTYLVVKVPLQSEFGVKLLEFETRNKSHATKNQLIWSKPNLSYKSALLISNKDDFEWRIQIPDTGIYSCFDTVRKSWYASNESGLAKRGCRILARTSGIWIDGTHFGMDWKLIGSFAV